MYPSLPISKKILWPILSSIDSLGSQIILWPIPPPMDSPRSQCHLSPGTYGLWYHLNLPSPLVPKGPSCSMPLAKNILLGINPSIEYQLIISRQSMRWEGWLFENLLCWWCSILNLCFSTQSPYMIDLEKFFLLLLMYKGGLVVLQVVSMYPYIGLLWNSQLYWSCSLGRVLSSSSPLENLVIASTHSPMRSLVFLFSCKTVSQTV